MWQRLSISLVTASVVFVVVSNTNVRLQRRHARCRRSPSSAGYDSFVRSKPTHVRLVPYGDIIFYTYPGASEPRHVVIYLGGDRILQAPETGQNVGYGTLSEFPGQTASGRRITEP